MKILTDTERTSLLAKLAEAPDDILLEAVARVKQYYVGVKEDMKSLNGFVGIRFTEAPKMTLPTGPLKAPVLKADDVAWVDPAGAAPAEANREPPGPAAQRITTASKDLILSKLRAPATDVQVNRFLGRSPGKVLETQMLLRRLWDLGLVTFDGTNFEAVKK
jgi:hypothetical protein